MGLFKDAPDPPDYKGAAEATAAADKEALTQQTWANRPTQINPWGKVDYDVEQVVDPATEQEVTKWTQNTTLDPRLQAALDDQIALQGGRSSLGASLMGRARAEYGTPMDWSGLTDWGAVPQTGEEARQAAEDALYRRQTSKLDPEYDQRADDMHSQLVAQGLRQGDAAYDRAMGDFERARREDYGDARDRAIAASGAEQQRQFGMDLNAAQYQSQIRQNELVEAMQRRGFSINEINALISGQQVGAPGFQSFSNAGKAEGPDYLGAANMQYNADLNNYSAEQAGWQGLMSGAGSIFGGFLA